MQPAGLDEHTMNAHLFVVTRSGAAKPERFPYLAQNGFSQIP